MALEGRHIDEHALDQPIWAALSSHHAQFAQGNALAKRYPSDVLPFASLLVQDAVHWSAFLDLVEPDRPCVIIQSQQIVVPGGVEAKVTTGFQMVAQDTNVDALSSDVVDLDICRDKADILELAELSKPGPLQPKTLTLGRFWGIRSKGKLVAMAGERFSFPGFTEISAICTHPDYRGHGFGKLITRHASARIRAKALTPFLHVYASNTAAVELYEQLGFQTRLQVHTAIIG